MMLRATKKSLYALVGKYTILPPRWKTTFEKAFRQRSYYLRWRDEYGMPCKAFLSTCLGEPMLSIEREGGNIRPSYVVHSPKISTLLALHMIENEEIGVWI